MLARLRKENVELAISVTCSALLGALGRGSHGPGAVAAFIASHREEHGGPHGVLSVACPDLRVLCESRAHPQARRGSHVIGAERSSSTRSHPVRLYITIAMSLHCAQRRSVGPAARTVCPMWRRWLRGTAGRGSHSGAACSMIGPGDRGSRFANAAERTGFGNGHAGCRARSAIPGRGAHAGWPSSRTSLSLPRFCATAALILGVASGAASLSMAWEGSSSTLLMSRVAPAPDLRKCPVRNVRVLHNVVDLPPEEVSRYGTQQKILRHGAPMDEES